MEDLALDPALAQAWKRTADSQGLVTAWIPARAHQVGGIDLAWSAAEATAAGRLRTQRGRLARPSCRRAAGAARVTRLARELTAWASTMAVPRMSAEGPAKPLTAAAAAAAAGTAKQPSLWVAAVVAKHLLGP